MILSIPLYIPKHSVFAARSIPTKPPPTSIHVDTQQEGLPCSVHIVAAARKAVRGRYHREGLRTLSSGVRYLYDVDLGAFIGGCF